MMANKSSSPRPPCCVAGGAQGDRLPCRERAPFGRRRPAGSRRKLAVLDDVLPKRVAVPTTVASRSSMRAIGAA